MKNIKIKAITQCFRNFLVGNRHACSQTFLKAKTNIHRADQLQIICLLKLLMIALCLIACAKSKPIILYDETKVSKEDIVLITIPNYIELFKLDGHSVSTPMTNNDINLHITKGEHTFIVRYYCMWKTPTGDTELIKSSKVSINLKAEAKKSYKIITHKPIKDYNAAQEMEKSPSFCFNVMGENSNQWGIICPTHLEEETEDTPPELTKQSKVTPENTKIDKKSLDVLKLIWENSSEADKKEFLQWLEKEKK